MKGESRFELIYRTNVRESGIREIFVCGIWKLGVWNPETWGLESGIQFKEYGIPLTIEVRNPSSTAKECLESSTWKPESKNV